LRRSDSIRNNCRADQRSLNYRGAKRGITAASAAGFRARARPPGTEFLDAETGRQKSPPKWVSAHRDKNPGNEWSEIPAETPYLASSQNRAVCGDWMVVCAVRYEPVSTCNSLLTGKLTGNFAFLGPQKPISFHETTALQRLFTKFPTQINRENILKNREISGKNREIW
jgi:hypothetical protein